MANNSELEEFEFRARLEREAAAKAAAAAPVAQKTTRVGDEADLLKGAIRGVADLGDTIINTAAYLPGKVIPAVKQWNDERKASLADFDTANDSYLYRGGRVGGNILATAPVGGLIGGAVKATSSAPVVQALGNAIGSGGLRTGEELGRAAGLGARAAGGAINGGASTALVSPENAGEGAIAGAVLPGVVRGLGGAANALRGAVRGPDISPNLLRAAQAGREAGYVVPPSNVNGGFISRALEGLGGKAATAQNASVKNQLNTNMLARQALGLPEDAPLTLEALNALRSDAGKAYADVAALPVKPAERGSALMNTPAAAEINPAKMVEELKQARADSKAYFNAYNRSADPAQLKQAKALDAAATELETALEKHAQGAGRNDLLPSLREARKRIAMAYTVERALNDATGNVNAAVLGKLAEKGKPLSGGLEDIGNFAAAFPKAAQVPEKMGSLPQISPLDYATALMSGNPAMLLARPAAREALLSGPAQNMLMRQPNIQRVSQEASAATQRVANLLARGAPVAISGR